MPSALRTASLLIAAATSACAVKDGEGSVSTPEELRTFLDACPLAVHAVSSSGDTQDFSIVRPEHIASFRVAATFADEKLAIFVQLNEEGDRRMLRYTKQNVGGSVAVYCGDDEMYQATILEPY
jgi:preprotein translocase subunit SecD